MIQGQGFVIKESKFDYFFGRVTSSLENERRSQDNLIRLHQLGIEEATGGKERLLEIFSAGLISLEIKRKHNAYGTTIVRKVEIIFTEVKGAIEISYLYQNNDFNLIPEVTTIIIKIYN